jgi:hypothetical protein
MTTTPMPIQRVRVDPTEWNDLGTAAPHGNRSATIRALIAWYLRRPGAELPERPPASGPSGCPPGCAEWHQYEDGCLLSPMIIGTISPRLEGNTTHYVWQCHHATGCEGLFHIGYPTAAAARRTYDRHLRQDHPDAI